MRTVIVEVNHEDGRETSPREFGALDANADFFLKTAQNSPKHATSSKKKSFFPGRA